MIEDRLKKLILKRYGSMIAFSKSIGMANSTLATILDRGIHKASVTNVIKICKALEISADGLAHGKIIHNKKKSHPESMMHIEDIIEETQKTIIEHENISINGKKMTEDERQDLADAIALCIEIIRVRNKRDKQIPLEDRIENLQERG